jgi:hypothetical protein
MPKLTRNTLVLTTTLVFTLLSSIAFANNIVEKLQPTREIFNDTPAITSAKNLPLGVLANNAATANAQSAAVNQSFLSTAWFQTIDLTLKRDLNGNGYYSRLYVRFDANTEYTRQPAYAVYSLIGGGYETIIYTSTVFNLYDVSKQDTFAIETNLDGIPRGLYKLRIQLKDAQTGYTLAEISGYDTATLDRMALEDVYSDDTVTYYEESGGSIGILAMLGLSCLYLLRRKTAVEKGPTPHC